MKPASLAPIRGQDPSGVDPTGVEFDAAIHERISRLKALGNAQLRYEREVVNLIASDNAYPRVQGDAPSYAGHMIQEGLLDDRPFAGAALHDEIERLAAEVACEVFGADHANLQPHSCSQANQAVYHALLDAGDTVMALDFRTGGHLTHGLSINFSGRLYRFSFYGAGADGLIDYDAARGLARELRPKLIICGSSSYPRLFDAARLRAIADETGAALMFDLSHEAGLIAGGAVENPVPMADVVTMSLDKTLRGPFGGMILCRSALASTVDRAVHPGTQSSFPLRKLTDAAHALLLTRTTDFRAYAQAVITNAKVLEDGFRADGVPMATDGTSKHYLVIDVAAGFDLTGIEAEARLESIGILSSRQSLPWDASSRSAKASGLRLGTAWASSRGYRSDDFIELGRIVRSALTAPSGAPTAELEDRVRTLVHQERDADVWGA